MDVHGEKPPRNSWRRDPIQDPRQFVVEFRALTAEAHCQALLEIYYAMVGRGLDSFFWEMEEAPNQLQFLMFFAKERKNAPVVIYRERELIGLLLINGCDGNHKCSLGIWLAPQYRGVNSHWIGRQCLSYVHTQLNVERIYASSPWPAAQNLMKRMDMRLIGHAPNYVELNGKLRGLKMYESTKQSFAENSYRALINTGSFHDESARELLMNGVSHGR